MLFGQILIWLAQTNNLCAYLISHLETSGGGPKWQTIVSFHKDFSPSGEQLQLRKLAHEL